MFFYNKAVFDDNMNQLELLIRFFVCLSGFFLIFFFILRTGNTLVLVTGLLFFSLEVAGIKNVFTKLLE